MAASVEWALNTKDTYERLAVGKIETNFDPSTFITSGIYLSYPEYYRKYFPDADNYEKFVDSYRPDPGMRVKGSGDAQRDRFLKIRDDMLKLAADTPPPPAVPSE